MFVMDATHTLKCPFFIGFKFLFKSTYTLAYYYLYFSKVNIFFFTGVLEWESIHVLKDLIRLAH